MLVDLEGNFWRKSFVESHKPFRNAVYFRSCSSQTLSGQSHHQAQRIDLPITRFRACYRHELFSLGPTLSFSHLFVSYIFRLIAKLVILTIVSRPLLFPTIFALVRSPSLLILSLRFLKPSSLIFISYTFFFQLSVMVFAFVFLPLRSYSSTRITKQ